MQSLDAVAVRSTEEQKEEAKMFPAQKWGPNPTDVLLGVVGGYLTWGGLLTEKI